MQTSSTTNPATFLSRLGIFAMAPIGLVLLALAVFVTWNTTTWLKRTVEAQGTVTQMLHVTDKDGDVTYKPVVRFSTAEGKTIEFKSSFSSSPPAYRVGQSVPVVYLPEEPEYAQIRGFLSLWMGPMIIAFIGTIFFLIGAAMIAASRRVSRELARPATA